MIAVIALSLPSLGDVLAGVAVAAIAAGGLAVVCVLVLLGRAFGEALLTADLDDDHRSEQEAQMRLYSSRRPGVVVGPVRRGDCS